MTVTQPKVVVAVIDDAIPFAHHRFRFPNGKTRFDAIWQQDGTGPSPGLFSYGALLTRAALDSLFARARTEGLGESEIYALSGVEDYTMPVHKPLGRRIAHGAHVADLACGFEPASAPLAEVLIGVQLDQAAVQTIVPARLSVHIVNALAFVVRRTQQLEAATPTRAAHCGQLEFWMVFGTTRRQLAAGNGHRQPRPGAQERCPDVRDPPSGKQSAGTVPREISPQPSGPGRRFRNTALEIAARRSDLKPIWSYGSERPPTRSISL